MALRNEQYNRILREYDRRQLENRHQLQDRKKYMLPYPLFVNWKQKLLPTQ